MTGPLRILYVGSYKPTYPRNKIFIEGLRINGAIVTECNERGSGFLKYVRLAFRLLRLRGTYDAMLVGFPGQEVMGVAWLCSSAPIFFDVFTSHYMGYILDRAYFPKGSLRARWYRFLDAWSCRLANVVILDTNAHIDFFVHEFGLPREKFHRVFLGANTDLHHPRQSSSHSFSVVFWGGFIPLQGTEYIIRAAKLLRDQEIRFILIGDGQNRHRDMREAEQDGLTHIEFPGKVSDEQLVAYIQDADVCLGAFSAGIKADITIQNKIFEALASRKPVLTARTRAIQELLTDRRDCVLCNSADPSDLANAIRELSDPIVRERIATAGYALFQTRLTEEHIGRDLYAIIAARCKRS